MMCICCLEVSLLTQCKASQSSLYVLLGLRARVAERRSVGLQAFPGEELLCLKLFSVFFWGDRRWKIVSKRY